MLYNVTDFLRKKDDQLLSTNIFKLKQDYNPRKPTLHLFFENEDDFDFYKPFIFFHFPGFKFFQYYQEGKKGVNDTYSVLDWNRFIKSRILFFRDKDYDDILGEQLINDHNFFLTCYYSIENYLVTERVFELILRDFHNFPDDPFIKNLLDKFKKAHILFQERLLLITSWILIYRELNQKVVLDDLKLENFFFLENLDLHYKTVIPFASFESIRTNPASTVVERNKFRHKKTKKLLEDLTSADPLLFSRNKLIKNTKQLTPISEAKIYIRGKFELWFLLECLQNLKAIIKGVNVKITNYNKDEKNIDKITKIVCKADIEEKNIFLIIPPLLHIIPSDIDAFLKTNRELNGNN